MNAKLTKEQWMQIGNKAGWLKTAQTQPSGNPALGFLPPLDKKEEERRKREEERHATQHYKKWQEEKKKTKNFPNALRSEEYSSLQSIIAVQDFAKVSQLLSRMDRVEKSELIKQLEETCRAFRSLIDTIEDKPYSGPPVILY